MLLIIYFFPLGEFAYNLIAFTFIFFLSSEIFEFKMDYPIFLKELEDLFLLIDSLELFVSSLCKPDILRSLYEFVYFDWKLPV